MDKEETHNEVRREASVAGLVAGLFILILIGIVAATVIMHFPAIHLSSTPPPPTSLPEVSGK